MSAVAVPRSPAGPPTDRSPYVGLTYYTENDADLFFGRDADASILIGNLRASRLTLLYAESGVGKSSVLRAAVAARLQELARRDAELRGTPRFVPVVFNVWSSEPVSGLVDAIEQALSPFRDEAEPALPRDRLEDAVEAATAGGTSLLVILDQFEEHFVYGTAQNGREPFAQQLARCVNRADFRMNVLISIREDSYAGVGDLFSGLIPNLYANSVHLDYLDREGGREAILRPIEKLNEGRPKSEQLEMPESALVEAVLDGVRRRARERADVRDNAEVDGSGQQVERPETAPNQIETTYLQLVMTRLWDEETTRRLRLATLEELGGTDQIIDEHLDRALDALSPGEQDTAASIFTFLVTKAGTKIALTAKDLSELSDLPESRIDPVLRSLAASESHILRPVDLRDHGRGRAYEIFHDALARPIVEWRQEKLNARLAEAARREATERMRRLAIIVVIALVALAVMSGLFVWALSQRSEAERQARLASQQQLAAEQSASDAREAQEDAEKNAREADAHRIAARRAAVLARNAQNAATRQRDSAQRARDDARRARDDATQQAAIASVARDEANSQRAAAVASQRTAEDQRDIARSAQDEAVRQRNAARSARSSALQQRDIARNAKADAVAARRRADARELVSRALSFLQVDPEQSVALALQSGRLEPTEGLEAVLRDGLTAIRAQRVFPGGGGVVEAAAVGPTGESGSAVRALIEAGAADSTVARVLVASAGGEARVFELGSGKLLVRVRHGAPITDAVLAPDGASFVTGGRDGFARRWNARTGAPLGKFEHGASIRKLAISPDGRLLVTAAGEAARVWLAADGSSVARLPQPFSVDGVSFNPSGTILLTQARDVRLYETSDFRRPPIVLDQSGQIVTARFAPIGDLVATGGRDDIAAIWDSRTGERRHQLAHRGDVTDLAWSPRADLLATSSIDNGGRVFRSDTGALVTFLGLHSNHVVGIAFSPDGSAIATASLDGSARIWGGDGFARSAALLGHTGQVLDVIFTPDGAGLLTLSTDGSARIWKPAVDPILSLVGRHAGAGRAVAVNRAGLIASVGLDNTLRVWRRNGSVVRTIPHQAQLVDVSFSRDGRLVLTAGLDGVARIWRLADGTELQSFGQEAPLRSAVFDASGQRVVTGGADGIARIWRRVGGPPRELRHGGGAVVAAVFSPDGRFVATAGENAEGRVWRAATGKLLGKLTGHHEDDLTSIAYSPDGKLLATSSVDADAHIWNAETFAHARALRGHTAVVGDVAFSPDGRWIATAGPTIVGMWETRTGRRIEKGTPVFLLRGHGPRVRSVAFAPDSRRVASIGDDGTVRTYLCELCGTTNELIRRGARRLDRLGANLTPADRRRYLGG